MRDDARGFSIDTLQSGRAGVDQQTQGRFFLPTLAGLALAMLHI